MRRASKTPVRKPTTKAVPVSQRPPPKPVPVERETPWTEAEVAALRAGISEGLSYGQISKFRMPKRSRCSIIGKCRRLGIREVMSLKERGQRTTQHGNAKTFATRLRRSEPIGLGNEIIPLRALPLEALTERNCKWPMGDPKSKHFGFCGHAKASGAYCDHHAKVAYDPAPKAEKGRRLERMAEYVDNRRTQPRVAA